MAAKKTRHTRSKPKKSKQEDSKLDLDSNPSRLLDAATNANVPPESISTHPFDENTIALAGGDMDLLENIRNMISGMNDYELWKCMEDIRNGILGPDDLLRLIKETQENGGSDACIETGDNTESNPTDSKGSNKMHLTQKDIDYNKHINIEGKQCSKTSVESNDQYLNEKNYIHEEYEDSEDRQKEDEEDEDIDDDVDEENNLDGREFSFDLELGNNFFDPYKFHDALFKVLQITKPQEKESKKSKTRIHKLFITLATLSDPYTQPSSTGKNNEMILSADLLSDLIISLNFKDYIELNKGNNVINLPSFDMAYDLSRIIEKIMVILNADNENTLTYINNDAENWEKELPKWLPHNAFSSIVNIASDFHHMMLLYTISTVSLLIIQKLYRSQGNICLNPFLSLYLQLWKNHTKIIYLGIEIDRRDEEEGFPGYPEVIRYMIKGSSAIRSMIALILNDDFERRLHDLRHESLINFMRPWGRKFTNGSITRDVRIFIAALLALGSELDNVTELLFNFDPEDRYDEDIEYMFEMELQDMENTSDKDKIEFLDAGGEDEAIRDDNSLYYLHHKNSVKKYIGKNEFLEIERHGNEEFNDGFNGDNNNENQSFEEASVFLPYELHPDCKCNFEDFETEYDYDEDIESNRDFANEQVFEKKIDNENTIDELDTLSRINKLSLKDLDLDSIKNLHLEMVRNINNGPSALRSNMNSEIDSKGRDWRDIPRGENNLLSREFIELLKLSIKDSTIFITPIDNLLNQLKAMTVKTLDSQSCEKIIRSVAWVVQYEHESLLMTDEEEKDQNSDPNINSDIIYNFLKTDNNFIKMIEFNPSSSFFIIDELLMAEGYRRVLIWFLTHLPLNQWLINYFHDLLIGLRGNPSEEKSSNNLRFSFSRMGPLELSEIEKSMLLHEFLSNAVIFLSRGSSYELEDLLWNQIEEADKDKGDDSKFNASSFITNRSNAQKLIKIICLMLKSLEKHNILKPGDPDYKVEIQTLLFQWVGVGFVPEARELFFSYSNSVGPADGPKSLSDSKVFKLIEILKTFDNDNNVLILLNIAHHYRSNHSTCFKFLKDLNSVSSVFGSDDELRRECDDIFPPLDSLILAGDEEKIVELLFGSNLLDSNANPIKIRKMVSEFMSSKKNGAFADIDLYKEHLSDG